MVQPILTNACTIFSDEISILSVGRDTSAIQDLELRANTAIESKSSYLMCLPCDYELVHCCTDKDGVVSSSCSLYTH